MTLWYNFDGEEFEYDASYSEIEDYLMSLPSEELQDPFAEAFNALPKDEQYRLLDERGEKNFACPNSIRWIEEDKKWCISEFLMEPSILALFEDELHDEFEEKAYEQFKDRKYLRRDPYGYNGVSRSDFY